MIKNILSKLTFDDIADNTNLPVSYKDNNKYTNLIWNTFNTAKISHSNNIKVLNISNANIRLSSNSFTNDKSFRINDFELDINISFNSLNSSNGFFGITSGGNNWIYFNAKNSFVGGLSIISPTNQSMQFNYKFVINKDYNIIVSSIDNKYRLIINGEIIGYIDSSLFISSLPSNSTIYAVVGSGNNIASYTDNFSNGKIWNVNVSYGAGVKNENPESLTKYGTNLLSRLNFDNIQQSTTTNIFTPNLEVLFNPKVSWDYDKSKINEYIVNTTFKTNISTEFSLLMKISNTRKNIDTKLIEYGNFKVIYNYTGVPEPEVIVTDKTTVALNFENGIIDEISTTIWDKSGTADLTTNKIFGNNSFETKSLGDSLSTNSNIISGGSTPFTIDFYALIKEIQSNSNGTLYSQNNSIGAGSQYLGLKYDSGYKPFFDRQVNNGVSPFNILGKTNIKFNDINKFTTTYDGSALRLFINDELDIVIGTVSGWNKNSLPFEILNWNIPGYESYRAYTKGLLDNINIFDGEARQVRNYDEHGDKLLVDLSFDGENNSTKIIDNGTLLSKWITNGSAKLSTTEKFDSFSSLEIFQNSFISTMDSNINLEINDFTIYFEINFKNIPQSNKWNIFISNSRPANDTIMDYIYFGVYNNTLNFNFSDTSGQIIYSRLSCPFIPETNKIYKFSLLRKKNDMYLYLNGKFLKSEKILNSFKNFDMGNISIGSSYWDANNNYHDGYIKNFKIYKGVAIVPKSMQGKIKLDFDNNLNDNYNNSTWTNSNVTFDQINSVKGYSAYFNGTDSSYISTVQNDNLNFYDNNFSINMDFMSKNTNRDYGMLLSTNHTTFDNINTFQLGYGTKTGLFVRKGEGATTALNIVTNINTGNDQYYNTKLYRKNGVFSLSLNDVVLGQYNQSNNLDISNNGTVIGGIKWGSGFNHFGNIDNFNSNNENLSNYNITYYKGNSTFQSKIYNNSLLLQYPTVLSNPPWYYTAVLDDTPIVSNFICEVETLLIEGGGSQCRVAFRTNDFSSNEDGKFGFVVYVVDNIVRFGRGSNSTTYNWYDEVSADAKKYFDNKYHIFKIKVENTSIKLYIDNVLLLDVTNTYYTNISSKIAFHGNGAYSYRPCNVKSVKISDLNNNEIYYRNWNSLLQNEVYAPAVHLPLETNSLNIGSTDLVINEVGNPIYTVISDKKCIKFEAGKYLTVNSNNIFNLGLNSDFYIEMDIYVPALHNTGYGHSILNNGLMNGTDGMWLQYLPTTLNEDAGKIELVIYTNAQNTISNKSSNKVSLEAWNNLKFYRNGDIVKIVLNGIETIVPNNIKLNFAQSNTHIGMIYNVSTNATMDGYMSNFKMFLGTSQPIENYNDKKVLDIDFSPTRKSYLFKDNNNKCVIHSKNVTQRDYKDSKYCLNIDNSNKLLSLGKNNMFNFKKDDFIIYLNFKLNSYNTQFSPVILSSGETSVINNRFAISVERPSNTIWAFTTINGNLFKVENPTVINLNTIYHVYIIRKNGELSISVSENLNSISNTISGNFDHDINMNLNNNTYIGNRIYNGATNNMFNGYIYSIKVLRNTSDLTLLENELSVFNESFKLTNGDETLDQVITNDKKLDSHDIRFIKNDLSTKLIVDGEFVEVPNVENSSNELILLDGYNSKVSDIKLYDKSFIDDDNFLGNTPIDTVFGDIEYSNEDEMELFIPEGDYNLVGFIEGYTDREFSIYNTQNNYEVYKGIEDYNINGLDEYSLDDYEINDLVGGEKYKVLTHEMIKGFISGTVNLKNCGVTSNNMEVFCYRSDNYRHIGTYSVDKDGKYVIPNLDVNSRYDIIFRDKTKKIKDQISNYRKPMKY